MSTSIQSTVNTFWQLLYWTVARKLTNNEELMEFESSCPQDTVGLVVLKVFLFQHQQGRTNLHFVICHWPLHVVLNMELKVRLQIFPHKESCERWKHGSTNSQNWHFLCKFLNIHSSFTIVGKIHSGLEIKYHLSI